MDHRLREIEQWVAEAREDLGDGGQDAYLQKLYLLDAEIRAVIRENGVLPSAYSPVQTAGNVRRQSTRALALGGAALVAVLTAATVLGLSLGNPSMFSLQSPRLQAASRPQGAQAMPLGSRMVLAGRSVESEHVWLGLAAGSLEEELPEVSGETFMVFEEESLPLLAEETPMQPAVILASASSTGQRELPQTTAQPQPASMRETSREPVSQPVRTDVPRPVEVLPAAIVTVEKEAVSGALPEEDAGNGLDAARLREALKRSLGG